MLFYRKFSPPNERGLKKIISKMLLTIVPKSKYDNLRKYFEKNIYLYAEIKLANLLVIQHMSA